MTQRRTSRPPVWRRLATTVSPEAVALCLAGLLAIALLVVALPR